MFKNIIQTCAKMKRIILGKDPETGREVYMGHQIHKKITKYRLFSPPEFVWIVDNKITVKSHRDALLKIERMVDNEHS